MRFPPRFVLVLALTFSVVPASGQIQFALSDSKPVGRGPQFVATGRFEPDALRGVVSTSFWVDEVTVFPAASAGVLAESFAFGLGRNLRDLVSFDVNGDDLDDLIIADEAGGSRNARLFVMTRAPGGFTIPEETLLETTTVEALCTGDFDGIAPLDVATTNGRAGTVSLVYGTPGGFVPQGNVFLAGTTSAVAALDLNGDGLDDLAVLTQRDGLGAVTALQSDGVGFAVLGAATALDIGGVQMVAGNFDAGGGLDLAVIGEGPQAREYSLRTLFHREPEPGSMDPRFLIEAQRFPCPLDSRGNVSRCTIIDAVTGDFDDDGFDDLALSMPEPGVVVVLPRRAGEYGEPVIIDTPGAPRALALGDLSGDGIADVVVTDFSADVVMVATSVPPPKKETGESCVEAHECETAACVDTICCAAPVCGLGERCDISSDPGQCRRPLRAGQPCGRDSDCLSGICEAGEEGSTCVLGSGGCTGDCDGDGLVTVNEIVVIIQIALGEVDVEACLAADPTGDGAITVDEIVTSVEIALGGC